MSSDDVSIKTLKERCEQEPQDLDNVLNLVRRYSALGRHADALRLCRSMLKLHSRAYSFLLEFANALYKNGNTKEARLLFKRLAELLPNRIEAWNNWGVLELAAGNIEEARNAFDQVLLIDPQNAGALCNTGNCHAAIGDTSVAAAFFERAVDAKDNFVDAWYNLGNSYFALGRYGDAKNALKKAVEYDSTFGSAYKNLGATHERLEEYGDAVTCYTKAASLNKNDASIHANMAGVYVRMGQHAKAFECGKRAVRLAPSERASWNALRVAAMQLGEGKDYCRAVTAFITQICDDDLTQSIRDLREMGFEEEAEDLLKYTVKLNRKCNSIDELPFTESKAPTLRADEINRQLYKTVNKGEGVRNS